MSTNLKVNTRGLPVMEKIVPSIFVPCIELLRIQRTDLKASLVSSLNADLVILHIAIGTRIGIRVATKNISITTSTSELFKCYDPIVSTEGAFVLPSDAIRGVLAPKQLSWCLTENLLACNCWISGEVRGTYLSADTFGIFGMNFESSFAIRA